MPSEVAAIVLAAGRASRFGAGPDTSKVYAMLDGQALVARAVAVARASAARPIVVVTGQAAHRAEAALRDAPPDVIVDNPAYASGMASSLRAGLAAVPAEAVGALIMLADMPLVAPDTLDALIRCFDAGPCDAAVPSHRGRTGNPVLLGRSLFGEAMALSGDEGARRLLRQMDRAIRECPVDDPGILADIDTPEALRAAQAASRSRPGAASSGVSAQALIDSRSSIASAERGGSKK